MEKNLEKLYKVYLKGDMEKYREAKIEVKYETGTSIVVLDRMIDEYNCTQSYTNRQKYDNVKMRNDKRKRTSKIVEIIDSVIADKPINYDGFSAKDYYFKALDSFALDYPTYKKLTDQLKLLVKNSTNYEFKTRKFAVDSIFNVDADKCTYIYQFQKLLKCETEKEAISLYKKYHFTRKEFNQYMDKIRNKTSNEMEIIKLEKLYNAYVSYYGIEKNLNLENKLEEEKAKADMNYEFLKELLHSDETIEMYCHRTGERKFELTERIGTILRADDVLKLEYYFEMGSRNNYELYCIMDEIISRVEPLAALPTFDECTEDLIENNKHINTYDKSFDFLDYRLLTKLTLTDCYNIMCDSDRYTTSQTNYFKGFVNHHIKLEQSRCQADISEDACYEVKLIINGEEVSDKDKEAVIKLFKEKDIKLNYTMFKYGLRKQVNGELTRFTSGKQK